MTQAPLANSNNHQTSPENIFGICAWILLVPKWEVFMTYFNNAQLSSCFKLTIPFSLIDFFFNPLTDVTTQNTWLTDCWTPKTQFSKYLYFFYYNKMHQSLSLLPWKLCIHVYTYMQYIPDLKNIIKKYYIIVFICNKIKLNSWYVIRQMYNKLNTHVNQVNNRPIQLYTVQLYHNMWSRLTLL